MPVHARIEDKPFIPPRPVEPGEGARPMAAKADPFAEADMANGAREPERPRTRSGLFGFMNPRLRPSGEPPLRAPAPGRPASPAAAKPAEASLPLGPAERTTTRSAETEDDLLDIPAFLRRQAN
jgi:cell division protein FtsZ